MPASPHFSTISLAAVFNARRDDLPEALRAPGGKEFFGERVIGGKPFAFGVAGERNVVLLDGTEVEAAVSGRRPRRSPAAAIASCGALECDARRQRDVEALLTSVRPELVVQAALLQSPWALL